MLIGMDDWDEIDDTLTQEDIVEQEENDSFEESLEQDENTSESLDIVDLLLLDKGIADKDHIKFEGDNGEIEEVPWSSLNDEEKLEILRTNNLIDPSEQLDDLEVLLINAIRSSLMAPSEYINYIQRVGIDNYVNSAQMPHYLVDDISDDDLYMTDALSKIGADNITAEELADKLIKAKENEQLYLKEINAIRLDYRNRELQEIQNQQLYAQQEQIEQFNRFAESIENEIRNFNDFGGYTIDMSEDEMEEVYDFLTGRDLAGVSFFGKALNDPKMLVRIAWYLLNGEKAMADINDYWTNEIKQSRRNNQRLKDKVTIKQKTTKNISEFDDSDDW